MKYIISIANNGYISSIGYGIGANKELKNFSEIDFNFLDAYKYNELKCIAILDEAKKEEIIKERNAHKKEEEHAKEISEQTLRLAEMFVAMGVNANDFMDRLDAQTLYTALMTDTLIESEETLDE